MEVAWELVVICRGKGSQAGGRRIWQGFCTKNRMECTDWVLMGSHINCSPASKEGKAVPGKARGRGRGRDGMWLPAPAQVGHQPITKIQRHQHTKTTLRTADTRTGEMLLAFLHCAKPAGATLHQAQEDLQAEEPGAEAKARRNGVVQLIRPTVMFRPAGIHSSTSRLGR